MRELPEVSLKIMGEGPQKKQLKELARKLGLKNVEFMEPGVDRYPDSVLACCRFIVVPSRWHENLPYAILHAFFRGKAVVASERGGIPEIIKDGISGRLVPAEDSPGLAAAIKELWENPEKTAAMGEEGRKYVKEQFSEEGFYNTLLDIYNEVLERD